MATRENPTVTRRVSAPAVLQKGRIQSCDGYLWKRKGSFLHRWEKEWFEVIPGELHNIITVNIDVKLHYISLMRI